jgi:hypothetical protein
LIGNRQDGGHKLPRHSRDIIPPWAASSPRDVMDCPQPSAQNQIYSPRGGSAREKAGVADGLTFRLHYREELCPFRVRILGWSPTFTQYGAL